MGGGEGWRGGGDLLLGPLYIIFGLISWLAHGIISTCMLIGSSAYGIMVCILGLMA